MTDEAIVAEVVQMIRVSETRVTAQVATFLALEGAGFNTAETEVAMWHEWEALSVLHRQERAIFAMDEP